MTSTVETNAAALPADPYWPVTARAKGWPVWQIAHMAAVAGAYVEVGDASARVRRYDGVIERVPRDSRTYAAKAQDAALNFASLESSAQASVAHHAREIAEGRRPRRRTGDVAPPADYGICASCRAPRLVDYAARMCSGCGRWMNSTPTEAERSSEPVEEPVVEPAQVVADEVDCPVQAVAVDPVAHAEAEVELPSEPWVAEALAHGYPRSLIAALSLAPGAKLVTAPLILNLCEGGGAFMVSPTTRVEPLHFARMAAPPAVTTAEHDAGGELIAAPDQHGDADWYNKGLQLGWLARQLDAIRSLSSGDPAPRFSVSIGPDSLEMKINGGELTRVARYIPVAAAEPATIHEPAAPPADVAPKLMRAAEPPQPVVRRVAPVAAAPVAAAPVAAAPVAAAPWATRALELGWPPARVAQLAQFWPPLHPMEVMADRMLCPCGPGGDSKFVFTHTGTSTSILGARYRAAAQLARKIEPSVPAIHTAESVAVATEGPASTISSSAIEQPAVPPAPVVAPESPVLPCVPCEREGLRRDACRLHPQTGEGVCDDWEQIHPHGETLGELIRAETDALAAAAEPTIEAPDEPAAATPTEADALPWDPAPETTQGADDQAPAAVTEPRPPQPAAPKLRRGEWHPPLDLIDPVTKEPWIYLQAWTDASASYGQRGSAPEPAGIGVVLVLEGKEHRAISQRIEDGDTYFAELRAIEIAIRQCPDDEPLYVVGDNESSLRVSAGEARPNVYEDVVQRIRKMVEIRLRRGAPTYFRHVKGHSRHYFNHRADYLAHDAVKEFRKGIVRDPALETPPNPKEPPKPKEPRAPRATKVVATVTTPAAPAAAPAGPSPEEVAAATDARVIPSFLPASERRQPRLGLW